jgi:hypothetical protein
MSAAPQFDSSERLEPVEDALAERLSVSILRTVSCKRPGAHRRQTKESLLPMTSVADAQTISGLWIKAMIKSV